MQETQETQVRFLSLDDPLEQEMATRSSILAWEMGNPMDRGAWWATVHRAAKSWTRLKQLSMYASTMDSSGTLLQYLKTVQIPR